MLTGVCLSGFSGCVGGCTRSFRGNGIERHGGSVNELGGQIRCLGGEVGRIASISGLRTVQRRIHGGRRRVLAVPDNGSVSRGFHELGCMHCTSSFLVKIVKGGTRYRGVGTSIARFVRGGLGLRVSRRGALVAGTRSDTGFLNCRVSIHGSCAARGGTEKRAHERHGNGIVLRMSQRMVGGGLLDLRTVGIGAQGNGRI